MRLRPKLINWDKVNYQIRPPEMDRHRMICDTHIWSDRLKRWELLLGYLWLNMMITIMYLSLEYMMSVGNIYVVVFLLLSMLLTTFYMMGEFQENFSWWVKIPQMGYLILLMIWVFWGLNG